MSQDKHTQGTDLPSERPDASTGSLRGVRGSQAGDEQLREELAAIEHERWSDWQAWCHGVLWEHIPRNIMETYVWPILKRWDKQLSTPYDKLSDTEKASDMEQVDRYWPLIDAYAERRATERAIAELEALAVSDKSGSDFDGWDYLDNRIAELRATLTGKAES